MMSEIRCWVECHLLSEVPGNTDKGHAMQQQQGLAGLAGQQDDTGHWDCPAALDHQPGGGETNVSVSVVIS